MTESEAHKMLVACLEADRCRPLHHCQNRMRQRGLTWPDIMGVLEQPDGIMMDGYDDYGRERCVITGRTDDRLMVKIVCALNMEQTLAVLVTVHFED